MKKLDYYVATSIDNFIAKKDGSADGFLTEGDHVQAYLDSFSNYDSVIMGKTTYEFGYEFGLTKGQPVPLYSSMQQYVVSSTLESFDNPKIQVIRKDVATFISQLKEEKGLDIYLCGGALLATFLLQQKLIDRLIIKVNPILFGEGIPLFYPTTTENSLSQSRVRTFSSGVVFIEYDIEYPA